MLMFVTSIKMKNVDDLSATCEYPPNVRYMVLLRAKDHAGSCYPRYAGMRVTNWQH